MKCYAGLTALGLALGMWLVAVSDNCRLWIVSVEFVLLRRWLLFLIVSYNGEEKLFLCLYTMLVRVLNIIDRWVYSW